MSSYRTADCLTVGDLPAIAKIVGPGAQTQKEPGRRRRRGGVEQLNASQSSRGVSAAHHVWVPPRGMRHVRRCPSSAGLSGGLMTVARPTLWDSMERRPRRWRRCGRPPRRDHARRDFAPRRRTTEIAPRRRTRRSARSGPPPGCRAATTEEHVGRAVFTGLSASGRAAERRSAGSFRHPLVRDGRWPLAAEANVPRNRGRSLGIPFEGRTPGLAGAGHADSRDGGARWTTDGSPRATTAPRRP